MRRAFLVLMAAALLLVAPPPVYAASDNGSSANQKPLPLPLPKGNPQRPVGVPALAVKAGAKPPFTAADVAAYIAMHNLPMNAGAARDIAVVSLDFISAREAAVRLGGAQTGLPDQTVVGFATLKGRLLFSGPSGAQPAAVTRGYAIFDSTSGNLLMVGSL